MHFSDPALWYMEEERRREENRRRNQNILDRQLFQQAEQRGYIDIQPTGIVVLDVAGAMNHFKYHPNLVDMCPNLGWALRGDTSKLEPSLTEVWHQVSMLH